MGMANEPNDKDFTIRFSQKNSALYNLACSHNSLFHVEVAKRLSSQRWAWPLKTDELYQILLPSQMLGKAWSLLRSYWWVCRQLLQFSYTNSVFLVNTWRSIFPLYKPSRKPFIRSFKWIFSYRLNWILSKIFHAMQHRTCVVQKRKIYFFWLYCKFVHTSQRNGHK